MYVLIIGHENTKKQLNTATISAKKRNMPLPHILLSGAAGCGKTSVARHVADINSSPFLSVVPNSLKDYDEVLKILDRFDHSGYDQFGNRTGIIKPTILFIDEIHNLPIKGQELMGLVMENFLLESNKPNKYYWVPFFTLIGATTISGKLSKPFRDRFKLTFNFQPYELEDMVNIVIYHASRLKVNITNIASEEIAKRGRGTPRIVVGLVERVRDYMLSINSPVATRKIVTDVFDDLGIDEEGFTVLELRILKVLFDTGLPVGLDNLSIILQEDPKNIRDFAEPYLIRKGLILVSGKGRIITEKGIQHLKSVGKTDKFMKQEIEYNYERR